MDKNIFLIFNDILYDLYQCTSAEDLKNQFLPRLKLLLPFSYASILLRDDTAEGPCLSSPICYPEDFCAAEEAYLKEAEEDQLLWLIHSRFPFIFKLHKISLLFLEKVTFLSNTQKSTPLM